MTNPGSGADGSGCNERAGYNTFLLTCPALFLPPEGGGFFTLMNQCRISLSMKTIFQYLPNVHPGQDRGG